MDGMGRLRLGGGGRRLCVVAKWSGWRGKKRFRRRASLRNGSDIINRYPPLSLLSCSLPPSATRPSEGGGAAGSTFYYL